MVFFCSFVKHTQAYMHHDFIQKSRMEIADCPPVKRWTGKNLRYYSKERLKFGHSLTVNVCLSRTGKNSVGQVDPSDTFPKERLNNFVISAPAK